MTQPTQTARQFALDAKARGYTTKCAKCGHVQFCESCEPERKFMQDALILAIETFEGMTDGTLEEHECKQAAAHALVRLNALAQNAR